MLVTLLESANPEQSWSVHFVQESGLFVYLFHQFDCQWSVVLFLSARESWDTCDNLNVAGKDVQLIVTDFSETAGENCTILKSCLASQNPDGLHSEENIGEYDCRDESLSTPNVLPCTYDKPLSFLALNCLWNSLKNETARFFCL